MRYHEIASGFRVPVSGEEQRILRMVGQQAVAADALRCERDQEVARTMVLRGLLDTCRDKDGKPAYRSNSVHDVWRERDG